VDGIVVNCELVACELTESYRIPPDRIHLCYNGIDIFVLPSLSEALSNSLMEAMACGCVVVATRVGGNPELVIDGQNGLLCAPADAADLTAKLGLLLRRPDLRQRFAQEGARFIQQFSTQASLQRLEDIYLRVLGP
jgi:glycosyltransferase involved in cell wall biosynthesis